MDYRSENILYNLRAHAAQRDVPVQQVVSLKVRAVQDRQGKSPRYLGGDVYDDLVDTFSFRPGQGPYRGGQVFRAGEADFVEHESGPEILVAIAAFGNAIEPYMTVVGFASLVGGIATWLARRLRPKAPKTSGNNDHSAGYIRVEKREVAPDGTLKETIIVVIDTTAPPAELSLVKAIERATDPARVPARAGKFSKFRTPPS